MNFSRFVKHGVLKLGIACSVLLGACDNRPVIDVCWKQVYLLTCDRDIDNGSSVYNEAYIFGAYAVGHERTCTTSDRPDYYVLRLRPERTDSLDIDLLPGTSCVVDFPVDAIKKVEWPAFSWQVVGVEPSMWGNERRVYHLRFGN